jgi:hypothetical protein
MGYYFGPFGDERALDEADEFLAKSYAPLNIPAIYLTATERGLGILPTRPGIAVWLSYSDIATVTLHPVTTARMTVIRPDTAHQLGRVSIKTTSGRAAELGGTTVDRLAPFLQALGARIV